MSAANRLREIRLREHFTQGELAIRLGVSEGTVRRWESGRSAPTRRHAKALAKLLRVTVEDLGLY